jgi:isopenicillin N synthase-like dioxygenase
MSGHTCQRVITRSSWRRREPRLQILNFEDVHIAAASLLRSLQEQGAVLLKMPASGGLPDHVQACFSACRRFFERPLEEKAQHGAGNGVGQQHGYMSYLEDKEGGSECFEVKCFFDAAFRWPPDPPNLQRAVSDACTTLHEAALQVLDALISALHLRKAHVHSLLDAPASPDVPLDVVSHSAMRVWSYTRALRSGWHADNTLLTIAPAASCVGLHCRLLDGTSVYPERQMLPDHLLVFAGDALSYLSGGRLLALMHEVTPPPSAAPRLSMPFFLRARRMAYLDPACASCGSADERILALPRLRVSDLERNVGNVRSSWFWKRLHYFAGCEWHAEQL